MGKIVKYTNLELNAYLEIRLLEDKTLFDLWLTRASRQSLEGYVTKK